MGVRTGLLVVMRNMIIIGVGLGLLQPVVTLAIQNAIPRARLGVGTGAVTYLRSLGSTLGLAILGAVVANTTTAQLGRTLPPAAQRLAAPALGLATSQRVLVSPAARQQLIHAVVTRAVAAATAQLPPGPAHAAAVARVTAQVTTQVTTVLYQIFTASRAALAAGLQHGFWVAVIFAVCVLVVTFFFKDVPLQGRDLPRSPATAPRTGELPMAKGAGQLEKTDHAAADRRGETADPRAERDEPVPRSRGRPHIPR